MAENLFAGIETAPGYNRAALNNPDLPAERLVYLGDGRPQEWHVNEAMWELSHKRKLAAFIDGVDVGQLFDDDATVTGWQELRQLTTASLAGRYDGSRPTVDLARNMVDVADEGIATMTALAEVVGRVMMRHEFEEANTALTDRARRSVGVIIGWLGVSDEADPNLAWALSERKPADIYSVFKALRFNPKWFTAEDAGGGVMIDPARAMNLRGPDGRLHPGARDRRPLALFGCPARKIIPDLYQQTVDVAERSGLFVCTYEQERARYGY